MSATDPDESQLLDLVGALYDAALDPAEWQPLATKLARLFGSESTLLMLAEGQSGGRVLGATDNIRGEVLEDYEAYYYTQDQWVSGAMRRPDRALLGHELAPDDWYRKSEFLNELCVRAGVHHLVGAALPLGGERSAIVGIHRPRHDTPFDGADVARLDSLIPHVKRALLLTVKLSAATLDHQVALDGLERTHAATLVADGGGRLLFATPLGHSALQRGDGLRVANGRLVGADRASSARLALLVKRAADTAAGTLAGAACGGLSIERDEGRLPLTVLVAPFRPRRAGFGAPFPAALVFIRDPETETLGIEVLRDLFGLTRAQAAVAARLAEGHSLEEIALALRITLHTARDHLKIVFLKTGTQRQPQLVSLLTRTVATLDYERAAG
jgi:DNA-binding CsgD family transcriptional regulator